MKKFIAALLLVFLLSARASAFIDEGTRLGRGIYYPGPWWSFFRVNMIAAFQPNNANSYFGQVSWNPWLAVTEWFAFRGNVGITGFQANFPNREDFIVTEYQLFFSFANLGPITLEPGAGAQTWWGNGDSRLLLSVNVLVPVDEERLPWFRYLFFGYSGFFLPRNYTWQVKGGIEVTLW